MNLLILTACFGFVELGRNDPNVLDLISSLSLNWCNQSV